MKQVTAEMLRQSAISLLAQREYTRKTLDRKLQLVSDDEQLVSEVLDQLEEERLLSNDRFVENFIRSRIARGHGPVRISQELRQKGVDSETVSLALEDTEVDWFERAEAVRQRKFGDGQPADAREKAKQMRFLQYRGFPTGIVSELF